MKSKEEYLNDMKQACEDLTAIVAQGLKEKGYDGLFSDGECSCELDNLFPCGAPDPSCVPGHKIKCDGCEGYSYCIGPKGAPCPNAEDTVGGA